MSGVEDAVVFFDGMCGLCDRSIVWLMEKDRGRALKFAPLQGVTAREVLGPQGDSFRSMVLKQGSRIYLQSDAVIRILARLGGVWKVAWLLAIIPRPLRDSAYNYVAKRRYQWFGTRDSCRMPRPEDAGRLLD